MFTMATLLLMLFYDYSRSEVLEFEFKDSSGRLYRTTQLTEQLKEISDYDYSEMTVMLIETPSLDNPQYKRQMEELESIKYTERALGLICVIASSSGVDMDRIHTSIETAKRLSNNKEIFRVRLLTINGEVFSTSTEPIEVDGPCPDFKRQLSHPGNYFPENVFDWERKIEWYSEHLGAMHEPSLLNMVGNEENRVYRFLWLRSFHVPIAIRLTVDSSGAGSLTTKMLSGAGGYCPGILIKDETITVMKEDVREFISLLQKANYWELPTNKKVLGLDGAEWIIEGVNGGRYHVVNRWTPEEGEFRKAALYLLRLSKLEVEDIY